MIIGAKQQTVLNRAYALPKQDKITYIENTYQIMINHAFK